MRWQHLRIVYLRELRDTLRDRRTVALLILMPVVLYPALMVGFAAMTVRLTGALEESVFTVALEGASVESPPGAARDVWSTLQDDPQIDLRVIGEGAGSPASGVDALVGIPEGFDEAVRGAGDPRRDAAAAERDPSRRLVLRYRTADERSRAAYEHLVALLGDLQTRMAVGILETRGVGATALAPFEVQPRDLSTARARGGFLLGRILPFLLVSMILTGAFYPALDTVSGEKERGTLETSLVSPVGRAELVAGKLLLVTTTAILTAVLNLASMCLSLGAVAGGLPAHGPVDFRLGVGTVVALLALLLPLSLLFSAISVAFASFARTYKEGQHYLTPLLIVAMGLGMVSTLPSISLSPTWAAVPVAGSALLARELLAGEPVAWELGAMVFGVSITGAGLAMAWSVTLFRREDILFRGGDTTGIVLLPRYRTALGPVPTVGEALLALVLAAPLAQVASALVAPRGLEWALVALQVVIATIPVTLALLTRIRLAETFGASLSPGPLVRGVAATLAVVPAAVGISLVQTRLLGSPGESLRSLQVLVERLQELPLGTALLLIAVVPAVAEELLFRGYLQGCFQRRFHPGVGIVVVAGLFALYHLSLWRFFPQLLLGLVLGLVRWRTGSLLACMAAHAAYNAGVYLVTKEELAVLPPPLVLAVLSAAGVGVAWVLLHSRPRPQPGAGPIPEVEEKT